MLYSVQRTAGVHRTEQRSPNSRLRTSDAPCMYVWQSEWTYQCLVLRIYTWVSVNLSSLANSARSAIDRYCLARNFLSSVKSCCVVNGVRGFRLDLCRRSWQRTGPVGPPWLNACNRNWLSTALPEKMVICCLVGLPTQDYVYLSLDAYLWSY